MKNKQTGKRLCGLLLACAVLLSCVLGGIAPALQAKAADTDSPDAIGDGLTWSIQNGVLTIRGSGAMRDFEGENGGPCEEELPWNASYNRIVIEYGVTHIGSWAFYNSPATSVSIADSVTSIGTSAFAQSALRSVTIPGSVESWPEAFIMCGGLTDVVVSDGVEKLDNMCFGGCEYLSNVSLPFSLHEIGQGAFHMCHNLSAILIPDSVTSIGKYAFCDTGLTWVSLSPNVTTISESVFEACGDLGSVWIPDDTTRIEETAFAGCETLRTLHIPERVVYMGDGALLDCTNLEYICSPSANGAAAQYAAENRIEFRHCVPADHGYPVNLSLFPNGGIWDDPAGSFTGSVGFSQEKGSTVVLPTNLTREGFTFTGWYDTQDCSGTPYDSTYTFGRLDQNLYAGWAEIVETDTPTLTLDPNGGAFGNGSTTALQITQAAGSTYTLPTDLTLQHYTLSGWQLSGTNVGTIGDGVYTFGSTDETAIAQWTPVNYTLTLSLQIASFAEGSVWETYPGNGGDVYIEQPYGTVFTLPAAGEMIAQGYSFNGWFTWDQIVSHQTETGATSFTFTQNETMIAKWSPNTYTVTVDPNGGYRIGYASGTGETFRNYDAYMVSTVFGNWLRLFGNEGPIRRDGYRLVGFTGVNGSPVAGSFVEPDANSNLFNDLNQYYYYIGPTDETLVAQWEKIPEDKISVTIGDQIGVNLLLDLDARNADAVTVVYKDLNGDEKRETFTDFASLPKTDGGLYKIAVQIAPAQIADVVKVYIDGEQLDACVKDYCNTLTAGGFTPEQAALAQAVLDYGQAANNFFDYTEETISAVTNLSADDAKAWTPVLSDTTGKIRTISFMALTKPEFRFYMKDLTEAQAVAFNSRITVSGVSGVASRFVKNAQGSILLEVTGLKAEDMDETITVTIDGLGAITFAGNDFAKLMADNTATEALGAALYAYGAAAKACFG